MLILGGMAVQSTEERCRSARQRAELLLERRQGSGDSVILWGKTTSCFNEISGLECVHFAWASFWLIVGILHDPSHGCALWAVHSSHNRLKQTEFVQVEKALHKGVHKK